MRGFLLGTINSRSSHRQGHATTPVLNSARLAHRQPASISGGKSHLAAALGLALVQNGRRVLFMRTTDLVQRLQVARRELGLEAAITKLDKYQLLILDDIAYVTKDQAETSVLFELIATRYERRSLLSPP